jgi:hypothetical protein
MNLSVPLPQDRESMFYMLVTWYIYIFVLGRPPMVRVWALKQKTVSDTVHGNLPYGLGAERIGSLCKFYL